MSDSRQMIDAVQKGDAERVKALLESDPTLAAACDADGVSAVLHALYRNRRDLAEQCLAAGHRPGLHEAICLGQADRVREFIIADSEAAVTWSADGFAPLHLAAFFGHVDIAAMLLDAGANVDPTARNPMGVRPLHSAAAGQHVDVARLLLEHGADPNAGQAGGYTPLMSAAGNGNTVLIQALLRAGADASKAAADGRTAEALARERNHEEAVPLLRVGRSARR